MNRKKAQQKTAKKKETGPNKAAGDVRLTGRWRPRGPE